MPASRWLPIALAALVIAPPAAAQSRKVRVAVLEIRALGTESSKSDLLSEVALTEAASMRGFDVIGKSDINSIIGFEKQKQVVGCSDDSTCLAEIGGALGVDFILVGSLGRLGTLYRIDLKLVETKKARVRGRIGVSVEGQEEKLVVAVQKAVRDLLLPETPTAEPPKVAATPAPAPARESKPSLKAEPPPRSAEPVGLAPESARDEGAAPSSGMSRRTWAYVAGGAGLAFVVGGAVAGLSAKSAYDDEKAAAAAGNLTAYEDNKSKAKSMALVADGLYVVGAAGVGVGAWLFFTGNQPAVALEVQPIRGGALATIGGGF